MARRVPAGGAAHIAPAIAARGDRTPAACRRRGKFIDGTVTVDYANNPGTYLVRPLVGTQDHRHRRNNSNLWNSTTFVTGQPDTFNIRVANQNPAATSQVLVVGSGLRRRLQRPRPVHDLRRADT